MLPEPETCLKQFNDKQCKELITKSIGLSDMKNP